MTGEIPDYDYEQSRLGAELTTKLIQWTKIIDSVEPERRTVAGWQGVNDMDKIWTSKGLMSEQCAVKGFGAQPINTFHTEEAFNTEDGTPEYVTTVRTKMHYMDVPLREAQSVGFTFRDILQTGKAGFWLEFHDDPVERMFGPGSSVVVPRPFFIKPETASIVSISDMDRIFHTRSPEECAKLIAPGKELETLKEHSDATAEFVHSKTFQSLDRNEQQSQIDARVRDAETSSGITEASIVFSAKYAFMQANTRIGTRNATVKLGGLSISGVCLGLTFASRNLLDHKPIRSAEDLRDAGGLSLAIRTDEDIAVSQSEITFGRLATVPLTGQQIEAEIEPSPLVRAIMEVTK